MTSGIVIAGRRIGRGDAPYVIAEMSGNHNQSLSHALRIIDAAADAGAHAIKLQTYTADTITLDVRTREFRIDSEVSLWHGKSLHELYKMAYTPWEWHAALMQRAADRGIACFSSPFDESAVEFLETLNVPAYKIASFENNHLPLIKKAASTGKPLIISTGMASMGEIEEAVETARTHGCTQLALLKCTSAYPAEASDANLMTIPHLREWLGTEVGLSDHTMGIGLAICAVALGATVIEKHFTLDRSDGGVDSAFSLEPTELRSLVVESKRGWQALGCVRYGPTTSEVDSLRFRRSIYVARDMKTGDEFTADNVRVVRPGLGLHPRFYEGVLGRRISRDASMGTPLDWDMVGERDKLR